MAVGRPEESLQVTRVTGDKTGRSGSIAGRVVDADTGQALPYVTVAIAGPTRAQALTDHAGTFRFSRLPLGDYVTTVAKLGFVTLQTGQSHPFEPVMPTRLDGGQIDVTLPFALEEGAVVSGTVSDADGIEMPGVSVTAMRYEYVRGQRRLVNVPFVPQSVSDERGRYRIVGLPSGDVVLCARPVNGPLHTGDIHGGVFGETCWPKALSPAGATPVKMSARRGATVDIALQTTTLIAVAGRVVADDAAVGLAGGVVRLVRQGETTPMALTQVAADGQFELTLQATSGAFTLVASTSGFYRGGPPLRGKMPLVLNGRDLRGISIRLQRGATIRGQLAFASGTNVVQGVRISAQPLEPDGGLLGSLSRPVDVDGRFTLPDVFTRSTLTVEWPGSTGAYVDRVYRGGSDVTESGIEAGPGQLVSNVRVVVSETRASIEGVVRDTREHIAPHSVVVAVLTGRETAPRSSMDVVTYGRSGEDGSYVLRHVRPGEYVLAALHTLDVGRATKPRWLDDVLSAGERVTISGPDDGVVVNLTVALDPGTTAASTPVPSQVHPQ
jgi:hypothetical protein